MEVKDFERIDTERGAVLYYTDAINFLKWVASEKLKRAIEDMEKASQEDIDILKAEFEDLVYMVQEIGKGWEWVLISEHPMSASGLHIEKMKMANE